MDQQLTRYFLRELYWELDQHDVSPLALREALPGNIEVLSHCGYTSLRVRAAFTVFDIRLSWRKDTPPTITEVKETI